MECGWNGRRSIIARALAMACPPDPQLLANCMGWHGRGQEYFVKMCLRITTLCGNCVTMYAYAGRCARDSKRNSAEWTGGAHGSHGACPFRVGGHLAADRLVVANMPL